MRKKTWKIWKKEWQNQARKFVQAKEEGQKAVAKGVVMGDLIFHSLEANKYKGNKELEKKGKDLNEQFKNLN